MILYQIHVTNIPKGVVMVVVVVEVVVVVAEVVVSAGKEQIRVGIHTI